MVEADFDVEAPFDRIISYSPAFRRLEPTIGCPLVDCGVPSPKCGDELESTRLEFADFQRRAKRLADEFFCSGDCNGMIASIVALGCPSYHDELVALLLRASMDRKDAERDATVALLNTMTREGLLSRPQLARGFEKLVLGWDDLQLDVPNAAGQIAALLSSKVGLVDEGLFARLPEGLLRKLLDGLATTEQGDHSSREPLEAYLQELILFKKGLEVHLEGDLFCRRSVETVAAWIRAENKPAFHHEVVLAACLGCLGQAENQFLERQRLALSLLAHLMGCSDGGLTDVDMQLGISRLLGAFEKLSSEASQKTLQDEIVNIIRSAVEREILAAEFLKAARRLRFGGAEGVEVLRTVQRQTPAYCRRNWGSGDARQFQNEVREAILEFFDSNNTEELARIVEELHLSELEQARFLRKLMVTGMERGAPDITLDVVSALLGRCWTLAEVRLAFEQLRDVARDLVLDFPHCREHTTDLVLAAAGRGLLEQTDLINDGGTIV